MAHGELDEESLNELYTWVDTIPLSRPKRNIARDFSDGVLVAEVVKFYFPKLVEMHNYAPANSTQQKLSNWGHLNRKVLNKLNFSIPEEVVRKIAQCTPGVVELVLIPLRQKIEEKQRQAKVSSNSYQELGVRPVLEESNYLDTGNSSKPKSNGTGVYIQDFPGSENLQVRTSPAHVPSVLTSCLRDGTKLHVCVPTSGDKGQRGDSGLPTLWGGQRTAWAAANRFQLTLPPGRAGAGAAGLTGGHSDPADEGAPAGASLAPEERPDRRPFSPPAADGAEAEMSVQAPLPPQQ